MYNILFNDQDEECIHDNIDQNAPFFLILSFLKDILNNLDSCDLEDDDLMLDVDLPEDAPCENG